MKSFSLVDVHLAHTAQPQPAQLCTSLVSHSLIFQIVDAEDVCSLEESEAQQSTVAPNDLRCCPLLPLLSIPPPRPSVPPFFFLGG